MGGNLYGDLLYDYEHRSAVLIISFKEKHGGEACFNSIEQKI